MRLGQKEYERQRIFLIGDYHSPNGPGRVTRQLLMHLPTDTLYVKSRGKAGQALEIFRKSQKAGIVLCSGLSRQCLLGIRAASRKGRKSAYLMHGCVAYENEINKGNELREGENSSNQKALLEEAILQEADCILAVSQSFCSWIKARYPKYAPKTACTPNGVELEELKESLEIRDFIDGKQEVRESQGFTEKLIALSQME